jgi:hypothetical protein
MSQFVDAFFISEPQDPTAESLSMKLYHNLGNKPGVEVVFTWRTLKELALLSRKLVRRHEEMAGRQVEIPDPIYIDMGIAPEDW